MGDFQSRRRRTSRGRMVDPADRPGALRVGAADERLDALLEEEKDGRAASVPVRAAAVRRLAAAAPAQEDSAAMRALPRESSRETGDRDRGRGSGAGQVLISRAFGGNPQGQGLLAPLLHHHDLGHLAGNVSEVRGGHGSMAGSPQCPVPPQGRPMSYGPGVELGPL